MQYISVPSQLAVVPDSSQVLEGEPPLRRYLNEQEYVHTEPTFLELVHAILPWVGEARVAEHVTTA